MACLVFVRHIDLTRPAHAYFLGFAQTDGSHWVGTGRRGRLTIELSERDDAVLHSFAALFDVYSRVSYRERVTNFGVHRSATWTVCDLAFRRELAELGLPAGRKALSIAPPSWPCRARDYVRGLVDGDGSVGFTGHGRPFLSFATASRALADHFCEQTLSVAGTYRSVTANARDGIYNPMVTGEPAAALAAWLYGDACLALDRKREAAERVACWTRPTGMRARPSAGARRWTAEEDADVFDGSVREAASRLARSERSISLRRFPLRRDGRLSAREDEPDRWSRRTATGTQPAPAVVVRWSDMDTAAVHARAATDDVRVLVVDDHALVRTALTEVIGSEDGLTVVGECEDGSHVVEAAAQLHPDVVCLDLSMPVMGGLAAAEALRAAGSDVRIVVLTAQPPDRTAVAAVGADALVPKTGRPDALLSCLRAITTGVAGCPYCL